MATIALDVKINALESAKTLKELKTGIKDLNNELAGLEQGSEEFNRVASAVGNAKDKLASMNDELVQTTTKAGKFQSITAIASQLAAGFGAAQGVMAMFGTESEAIAKALQNVQASVNFIGIIKELEGFGGVLKNAKTVVLDFVKNGISALRSLWATMLANPITAILVGLTALGTGIAWLMSQEDDETESIKENIAAREESIKQIDQERIAVERAGKFRMDLAAAQGKSEEELLEIQRQTGNERIILNNKEVEARKKTNEDLFDLMLESSGDEYNELVKKYNDNIALIDKYNRESEDINNAYNLRKETIATKNREKEEADDKAAHERWKAAQQKRNEDKLKAEQELIAGIERNRLEELQTLENQRKDLENQDKLTYEKKVEFENAKYLLETQKAGLKYEELEKLRVDHEANIKAIDEQKAKDEEDKRNKEKEAADKKLADEIAAEEEYDAYIKDIEAKRLARKKAITEAEINLVTDSLNLISAITTEFAGKDEASQRKAFEINKKVQLALATIDMIKGVQSAFTSAQASPFTAVFPGYPYVQAAMAAAYGVMNIRKISQSQFEGGGGAGGGMASAGGGTGGAMSAPLQQGVNNTSTNLANLAQGTQEQKPIKAYVLQTDVASEDQKMKAIENKAKIE